MTIVKIRSKLGVIIGVWQMNKTTLSLVAAIFLLSLFDALSTIHHLKYGATEMNPLMAYLLTHGNVFFVVVKQLMIAFGCIILLLANLKAAKYALIFICAIYTLLDIYNIVLLVLERNMLPY
jgi:hypothetical protein